MADLAWIAADWGTTNLRLWLMSANGTVLDRRRSDQGMGRLTPDRYETILMDLIGSDLPSAAVGPLSVVCCGMAGSRQGWAEAPYARVPGRPPGLDGAATLSCGDGRVRVHILAGLKQKDPADVMRGEETQIAGVEALEPGFDGIVCLPGTHTKWVEISAGEVVSFRTFMTGELFDLLSRQSVLRHSVAETQWQEAPFLDGVARGLSRPAALSSDLFHIRAEALLHDQPAAVSRARLSGLLIGLELAGARPYWLGRDIRIVGAPDLSDLYLAALTAQAATVRSLEAETAVLAGLKAAHAQLETTSS